MLWTYTTSSKVTQSLLLWVLSSHAHVAKVVVSVLEVVAPHDAVPSNHHPDQRHHRWNDPKDAQYFVVANLGLVRSKRKNQGKGCKSAHQVQNPDDIRFNAILVPALMADIAHPVSLLMQPRSVSNRGKHASAHTKTIHRHREHRINHHAAPQLV